MNSVRRFVLFLLVIVLFVMVRTAPAREMIGKTPLPPPVPYLNAPENFFIGGGIAAGGGAGDGAWNFLVGPDYTCPNYLQREEIRLVVDGVEHSLPMEVHRARQTGIFYGLLTVGGLRVYLIDYAPMGQPWVARMVRVENLSRSQSHTVSVSASILPIKGKGRSQEELGNTNNQTQWVHLKLDTSLKCAMNEFCTNWADRYAVIAFDKPAAIPELTRNPGYDVLETVPETIAPRATSNTVLYHWTHYGDVSDADCVRALGQRDSAKDLADCILWWQKWFDGVAPPYSLDRVKDQRARDLVEGGLAILKMNECSDGGIVANERGWNMSYIRDAYCGLRVLTAFGHFEESKRFIQWLDRQYAAHGLIPDAAPGGSLTYAHPNGNNGRFCPEANAIPEVTALYILAARDYYEGTHDLATLTNVDISLRYSMDVQLKYAITNHYRLEFSGDETELCGASDAPALAAEGFNRKLSQYWSMTSVALCGASLDFYIQYVKAKGEDPAHYLNHQNNRTLNLYDELGHLQDALERDYWRTNAPGCPGGFYDWFLIKTNGAWPAGRLINFSLFPIYYGTPLKYPQHAKSDVEAMKQFFHPAVPLLPVTGIPGRKSLGHDLGYLLWGLEAINDPEKRAVYHALVDGPTVGCWGTYNEAYSGDGVRNKNGLRSFETGVDLSAIAKYWGIGGR